MGADEGRGKATKRRGELPSELIRGYPEQPSPRAGGELTLHVKAEKIAEVCQVMRDDEALRFELCSSVSGVDYLGADERRLHVVYLLTSMTYRRRVRLEAAVSAEAPHLPSVTAIYPTADWQEREAYDMFGIVFDGHQDMTRILMPDDWEGHPLRKDYPVGRIPVQFKAVNQAR